MSAQYDGEATTVVGRLWYRFEELAIAAILGAMTLITFVNVFFRYTFNWPIVNWLEATLGFDWPDSLRWGYQTTLILFAWLVLLGMSYAVRVNAHLGVDAILNVVNRPWRRTLSILSALVCVVYAVLLMKGSWDYFANFVNLPATSGRWFPTGLEEMRIRNFQAFYTFDEIGMPPWLKWMEGVFGEDYDKLPRSVGYVMLPFGALLFLIRIVEATVRVFRGRQERLIVSHEAEEDIAALEGKR